ncbi:hypothetical protein U1Q18_034471 [Sarracenia purpurea var. burkii]
MEAEVTSRFFLELATTVHGNMANSRPRVHDLSTIRLIFYEKDASKDHFFARFPLNKGGNSTIVISSL